LAFLKFNPFWKPLEGITAGDLLTHVGGMRAWSTIWEPLMVGKFGKYAQDVAASWFWARIRKRTPKLCYIRGGFHTLVETLAQAIINQGNTISSELSVHSIKEASEGTYSVVWGKQKQRFDRILLTVPTPIALNICPFIRTADTEHLLSIPHLHAQTLILETKEPILKTAYWLNITDRSFPFLAVVAHTNFMDPEYYAGHHITYFGNYLPPGHKYLLMTKDQLLKELWPYINRLNPSMNYELITKNYIFTGPFAQPVHLRHYSTRAPRLETPSPGIYLANLDSIYPWDRGTNYAVELGMNAARVIAEKSNTL
jgi:protoporphyrinogen oxidase